MVEKIKKEIQREGEEELQAMDHTSLSTPIVSLSSKSALPSTVSSLSSVTTQQQAMPQIQTHLTTAIDSIRAENVAAQQALMAQIAAMFGASGFPLLPQAVIPPEPRTPVREDVPETPAAPEATIPSTQLDEVDDMQDALSSDTEDETEAASEKKARKTKKSITKTAAGVARKAAAALLEAAP